MFDNTTPTQIGSLLQTIGTLGILAIIIFSGYKKVWQFGWQVKQQLEAANLATQVESQRADKAEAKTDRLQTLFEEKLLPALDSSNHVQGEAIKQLASSQATINELVREVAELKGSRR
jgi:hypothetical protein